MTRADLFLVEQGFAPSRTQAQAAIRAGLVAADGARVEKPSQAIRPGAAIDYRDPHPYVSRGGIKLAAALDHFDLSPEGRVCLDIGASTGGFTEVLLAGGATRVYAVDVGHEQLHPRIARDPRVVRRDGVNARNLGPEEISEAPAAIVIDVSFIGLKLALPPALELAGADAWAVALVKPQFELGRWALGKDGVVRDTEAQESALADMSDWLAGIPGWRVVGTMESPIHGGEGNREFLLAARKT